ncbi:MAG: flagellar hook-basal body complex protein FliE [Gemmataceae bacterium]|nr:flagellar hook-basal body complex protein FliE [Gemmataceae bacterium]
MNPIAATSLPIGGMPNLMSASASSGASGPGGMFGDLINRFVGDANAQQITADEAVQNMALGNADSMHGVLLEVAKADLAFRLVLEIRNRLSEAYQEVAKMPL